MRTSISEEKIRELVQKAVAQTLGTNSSGEQVNQTSEPTSLEFLSTQKMNATRKVALGTDHGGVDLKNTLKEELANLGCEVIDCGTHTKDAVDYPDIARKVAELVANGTACCGVIIDGAGIGSCMAANKVPGVRAALCYDYATAVNSREHNNANVLTLGAGLIGVNLAKQILKTWLSTPFAGGRHASRVDKIMAIEKHYLRDGK